MTASRALVDDAQVDLIDPLVRVLVGDCMDRLDDVAEGSVQCAVTSPPYLGLRDYGLKARDWPEVTYRPAWDLEPITVPAMRCVLGLEPDVRSFIGHLVLVFRKVWRALRPDGTLWLNLGGSFATGTNARRNASIERVGQSKPASWTNRNEATRRSPEGLAAKQFIPTPWRLAMALQADGWILRCEIVWAKKSPMPECVTDRPTVAHEPLFLFSKQGKYFYDKVGASEPLEHPEASKPAELARAWTDRRSNVVDPLQRPAKPYGSRNKQGVTGHDRGRPGDHRKASVPWTDTTGRRNARDVWWLASEPFKGAHTATFPSELVRRCLRAAVSEKGACSICGAAWRRRVETMRREATETEHAATIHRAVGWEPACQCGVGRPVPCVVLDPFGGTGTVGSVAKERGQEALLCEAQPDYLPLIARRVGKAPTYQPPLVENVITLLVEDEVESEDADELVERPRARRSDVVELQRQLFE